MSSSGQDIEISNLESPQSFKVSPYSSPSQQVPQLSYSLNGLTCTEDNYFHINMAGKPFLRVIEQPQDHFRFRYKSEMVGTHGCLLGKSNSSNKNKTHPTVELANYSGRAIIRCRLAQYNNPDEHPHKLLEDEQDRDVSYEVPEHGSYKVGFAGMGIIHTAKKDVPGLLYAKYSQGNNHVNPKELRVFCENEAKKINLNIVRLRFSAHDIVTNEEICPPVFSEPIHNMKSAATNDLKICRMSRSCGRPRGGDDVYIFVEKVNKKNIKIRFFERSQNGEEVWSAFAHFLESDVHHQYAIVFRTPQYEDPYITVERKVYIELVRPMDGRTSDPKEFIYKPDQAFKQSKKRKANSSCSSFSSYSGSLKSLGDVPATVTFPHSDDGINDVHMATTIQQIPQIPVEINSPNSDLGDALVMSVSATSSPGERLLYESPVLTQVSVPSLPDFNSTEIKQILEHTSSIPSDEKKRFCDLDWSAYLESFSDSLPDESTSVAILRSMLISDSGAAKGPSGSKQPANVTQNTPVKKEVNAIDKHKTSGEYSAFYKAEDGIEVKKLVIELCELIRKTPLKKQLVRHKLEKLFEKRLSNGDTFLHMSLCSNQESLVEYIVKIIHLIEQTHLLNIQNDTKQTILHLAIVNKLPRLVNVLVSKGCDPMLEDIEGNNAFHYAVMCRQEAQSCSCLESLLNAVKENNVSHNLNACNHETQTPLHLAVIYNSVAKTKQLLLHGARIDVRDADDRYPIHIAADMNYVDVMRPLLEYTPTYEVDALNGRGYTALQIVCDGAVREHTVEIVKMLLDKQANPLVSDYHSAWRLVRHKPEIRAVMKKYVADIVGELEIKSEPEDDIKSEPEDDSGDESYSQGADLKDLSMYVNEVSGLLDAAGAWRALAERLGLESMVSWYENTASPTRTLLNYLKECDHNITSRSLAMILEDIGQTTAARVIRNYLD